MKNKIVLLFLMLLIATLFGACNDMFNIPKSQENTIDASGKSEETDEPRQKETADKLEAYEMTSSSMTEDNFSIESEEMKNTNTSEGYLMDARVRDAAFTDCLIQVNNMVLKAVDNGANYADMKYTGTVSELIDQINSKSEEELYYYNVKDININPDISVYNPDMLIANTPLDSRIFVSDKEGKTLLELEYHNDSKRTCALKDCLANIVIHIPGYEPTCEFPTFIWKNIDADNSTWTYSSVTELFEEFRDDPRFFISEMNMSNGLEYRISFDILDHDNIYNTGKHVNFGYTFIFDPDTADLINIEANWDGGLNILGRHMYFEFID